jgi:hypothetical protein
MVKNAPIIIDLKWYNYSITWRRFAIGYLSTILPSLPNYSEVDDEKLIWPLKGPRPQRIWPDEVLTQVSCRCSVNLFSPAHCGASPICNQDHVNYVIRAERVNTISQFPTVFWADHDWKFASTEVNLPPFTRVNTLRILSSSSDLQPELHYLKDHEWNCSQTCSYCWVIIYDTMWINFKALQVSLRTSSRKWSNRVIGNWFTLWTYFC